MHNSLRIIPIIINWANETACNVVTNATFFLPMGSKSFCGSVTVVDPFCNCNLKPGCVVTTCYRLSKRPNCFRGTCSGLGTWQPRCTRGASSGMRHVVPLPSLSLTALVTASLSGAASPMMPALSMTRASAPVPVPFPQLSPHVPSYHPIIPSPCALGQQVIALLSRLIVLPRLVYFYPGS